MTPGSGRAWVPTLLSEPEVQAAGLRSGCGPHCRAGVSPYGAMNLDQHG